jgi:hypothetical protein
MAAGAWFATTADAVTGSDLPGEVSQLSLFTAQSAGTDRTAPVITVPAAATVEHGSTFDPMTGVVATDNADGSITPQVRVNGSVDTSRVGTYTLVYAVADTNGNTATLVRTVEVVPSAAPVNTAAPAISGATNVGGLVQASMGEWQNTDKATVSTQWFRNGVAISGANGIEYVLTQADLGATLTIAVSAKVVGHDPVVVRSAGFLVPVAAVTPTPTGTDTPDSPAATKAKASVKATAAKNVVKRGKAVRLRVQVSGSEAATGTLVIRVDGRKARTVKLAVGDDGRAVVRLKGLRPGRHKVKVAYSGSDALTAAKSTVVKVRIVR